MIKMVIIQKYLDKRSFFLDFKLINETSMTFIPSRNFDFNFNLSNSSYYKTEKNHT